jgi:hypothetical protein
MDKQPWMLFRTEVPGAHYFWEGTFPALVQVAPVEKREDWYWDGLEPKDLPESTIKLLNEIAATKRKTIFKVPGEDYRFIVVARGVFDNE